MVVTISRTDLARRTREIVEQVRSGQTIIVQSYDGDQVVLLDVTDYHILRALASHSTGTGTLPTDEDGPQARFNRTISAYLDETISLGKAAEKLGLSRFDLMDRFERLNVSLRLGPASADEARAEIETARRVRPSR